MQQFHPRVSVSSLCTLSSTVEQDLAFWKREHINSVGVALLKLDHWDRELGEVAQAALSVSNAVHGPAFHLDDPHRWEEDLHSLRRSVAASAKIGAKCLYLTTGPAFRLTTDQGVAAFSRAIAPLLGEAAVADIPIALEHSNQFGREYGCVHSLADAIETAEETGLDVCVELAYCWTERHVDRLFRRGIERIRLVQVSDFRFGTSETRNRVVPGDGDLPLSWLISELLDAGYQGCFDIELVGPEIDIEGAEAATVRAADFMSTLLVQLGA
jgi:sugar phosphate isomerase/epimerase